MLESVLNYPPTKFHRDVFIILFICNPAGKQTNQQTGENTTSLMELIKNMPLDPGCGSN